MYVCEGKKNRSGQKWVQNEPKVVYLHTVEKSQFSSKIGEVTLKYFLFHVHKYKVLMYCIKHISDLIFSTFQENLFLS